MGTEVQKGGWIMDKNDEACYIDVEQEDIKCYETKEYSDWNNLPDLILEQIFSYLTVKQRYYSSLVCRNWYRGFHLPRVWSNFIVEDNTLTRTKFNYYSGWQHVLDHLRAQMCLTRVGPYIKGLDFRPVHSFNNLYQFMTLISWCIEQGNKENCLDDVKYIGKKIKSLKYTFPCNMASTDDPDGVKLFGTGGQLLVTLKTLMSCLKKLKCLELKDLMLERYDAKHLLDEVLDSCILALKYLNLINVTLVHCPIMHIGLFMNLQILVISPQNIDDDVIILLADSKLRHLHLVQNRYTPSSICISSCSEKAWILMKRDNPKLFVHLRVESTNDGEILLQPEAPVRSIVYQSPKTRISSEKLFQAVDMYKNTLAIFGHELLPHFTSPKSFNNRCDSLLLLLTRNCYNINTLIIREKISTSTVILLARTALNLRYFYVRRNAVIIRCDWPRNPDWSEEFYKSLRNASKSYEETENEVSKIVGHPWKMLPDKLYKYISINVRENV